MKNVFKILAPFALFFICSTFAHADSYHKYDSCAGTLPSQGLSNEKQTYTVNASADGNIYDGSNGAIIIHINGTSADIIFDSTFVDDQQQRIYSGRERFQEDHFVKLNIKCASVSDKYCPAELTTNVSGSLHTFKLGCLIDKVDFPAPSNPGNCRPHHCR